MNQNMDIINQNSTIRNKFAYIGLVVTFLILSFIALFFYFKIKSVEKKPIVSKDLSSKTHTPVLIPTLTPALTPITPITPTSIPEIITEKFIDPDFTTEFVKGMKMTKTPFEKGQKYEFINDQITYDIYIGTGWFKEDPARNFNNLRTTINFLPAYYFTDSLSYIGFDFIGAKSKKYVTIKCTYKSDSSNPSSCWKLIENFYLIGG